MPTDQILDECLEKIRQGESLDHCLAAYPQEAETLRPLLKTAAALRSVPVQQSSPASFQKGRDHMFTVIDQVFPSQAAPSVALLPVSKNAFSRYSVQIRTWITGKENIDMKMVTRFAMAFVLVLAVLVGLGTTAVSASSALPGDLLYPLKTSAQNAQLMLTWNAEARQALERHFQEEYRNDVRILMQDGRQVPVQFIGTLDAIENGMWVIGGLPISVDASTRITGNPQVGDRVQVEATVRKDGSILASDLALNSASHHPEEQQFTPAHTLEPQHTPEPEHLQDDLEHPSSSATLQPTQMLEQQDHPTIAPSATAAPVHHDDGSTCPTCGSSSGGTTGSHDSGHDGGHDGGHE